MNNNYLIPANSKKSMLILGLFNLVDLIICGTGCLITFALMFAIKDTSLKAAIIKLLPALICVFLVIPLPNQHNVRTLIKNVYNYFTKRRRYFWKGWCSGYGEENTK